ncbi:uncharacterized protein [Penaeus vannamei]|uniref:uncharacterized protein n=1 Tax=Penaeus vannamei TaxID=6689 RepID=UPI00387F8F7F
MTSLISPKHPVEEIVSPRPRERRNGEKAEGEYSTKNASPKSGITRLTPPIFSPFNHSAPPIPSPPPHPPAPAPQCDQALHPPRAFYSRAELNLSPCRTGPPDSFHLPPQTPQSRTPRP